MAKKIKRRQLILLFSLVHLSVNAAFAAAPVLEVREGTVEEFTVGALLFSNRSYPALVVPPELARAKFIRTTIECSQTLTCLQPGTLYAITPQDMQGKDLLRQGFEQLQGEPFLPFGTNPIDRSHVYRKTLAAGETIRTRKWVLLLAHGDLALRDPTAQKWTENDGEKLYNGIVLPSVWPPRHLDPASREPMPVPYLEHPPKVIPIDVGRQLFVDDFLIEKTGLQRTFHQAEKYEGNPVFKPETPVELKPQAVCYLGHGGVFYDSEDHLFKMWYSAGDLDGALAYATSRDGFAWDRPDLGLPAGGNLILSRGGRTKGGHAGGDNCVWLDTATTNAPERIKFMTQRDSADPHWLAVSPDNQSWSEPVPVGRAGDYSSFFFNPFRNTWVYSIKRSGPHGRSRYYAENPEFLSAGAFDQAVYWCNADRLDEPDPKAQCPPQLYSLTAVAYESLLIGVFYVHLGPPNNVCAQEKRPKITELKLGFSRDGFHWDRPDRQAFIPATRTEGSWDRAYLHSNSGVCLVDGDRLIFPYCGFSGFTPDGRRGMYAGASVGYAMLRRDGFASMDAGKNPETLTTRPVIFSGKHLFVNLDAPAGALRVEVLDESGKPIAPFTLDNCNPLTVDSTIRQVTWKGAPDLSALTGQPVRFRFELTNGALYSFWVSRDESGRSDGYVAGGGPGYTGAVDTVGKKVFE